jgi:hypothetical protein
MVASSAGAVSEYGRWPCRPAAREGWPGQARPNCSLYAEFRDVLLAETIAT